MSKNIPLLLTLSLIICFISQAQDLDWIKSSGGAFFDTGDISVDASGNSYIILTRLFLIMKYNSDGELVWTKNTGGHGGDISVDASGNSYVTGFFGEETVSLGVGEPNETTLTSEGEEDIFIAKYNTSGELVWAKREGGIFTDFGAGISVDASGNFYVTGSFGGTATFGAGEPNETTLTSETFFIAKYNSNGALLWARNAGGTSEATSGGVGADISVDDSGNSYITGYFSGGTIRFGAGETNETTLTSETIGTRDFFIAKYSSSGLFLWAKSASEGISVSEGAGISVDDSDNSYVTGSFFGETIIFGAGEANETTLISKAEGTLSDIFIAKYSASGGLDWAISIGGTNVDSGRSISVDDSNNFYVTGSFFGEAVTFGAGDPNETILSAVGNADIFIAKYSSSGELVWVRSAGGASSDIGAGISVDALGKLYVTGVFSGAATFGFGEPNETILNSAGNSDVFVAKYSAFGKVNKPPTINNINNVIIVENDTTQIINLSGIMAGTGENQKLILTANSNNPELIPSPTVNYTSPETTASLMFTPTANMSGTATITVTIKDDGGTENDGQDTVTVTFDVTVAPADDSPILNSVSDRVIDEFEELTFTVTASDSDLMGNLTFSLDNDTIAQGASIDPITGVFSWTPTETQGPKIYRVTITVIDSENPTLFDSEEIKITVNDPSAIILELNRGWNLISLPKQPQDNSIENIYGDKIVGVVWNWNNVNQNYEVASTITTIEGYWVYSKGDFIDNNAIVISLP